ncbi:MAG: DsbA family protein, partial [Alphaproteobacteria bacterium]|nr:DsbA family protein [Alphaproteobacteria bacterium]
TALKLALFEAHFNRRRPIGESEVLLDIAEETGFDRPEALAALASEDIAHKTRAEERAAWDLNISGVPAMVLADKFLIPGAQPPEAYVDMLRRVVEKTADAAE